MVGNSRVVASPDQVSCDLSGEAAILNLKTNVYFGLNEVGARVWNLIREPRTVAEIRDALVEEYEVEPERCQADLVALLEELEARGLVEIDQ
jgi:hypothetical protein